VIQELRAEYCISAPLFMGGHDPLEQGDMLRPPALKGALRFWWRALNWSRLRQQSDSDKAALKNLHKEEADLFGSASGQSGQQAKFLLRLGGKLDHKEIADKERLDPGLAYLMGQGMYDRTDGSKKEGLTGKVTLRCILRPNGLNEQQILELQQALLALGLLGSVGARARKGFGSLSIHALARNNQNIPIPQDLIELGVWIKETAQKSLNDSLPPFTALSSQTHFWHLPLKPKNGNTAKALLSEYGRQMMSYRLSDKSAIGGIQGKGLFKSDSRELRKYLENASPEQAPRRAVFGLPNNVFFMDCKKTVEVNPSIQQRRASPLLAHLHEFPNGQRVMLATLFPAQFLPENEKVTIKSNSLRPVSLLFLPDWTVIDRFITQCEGKELTR